MAGENLELEKMGLYYAGDILNILIWKLETIYFTMKQELWYVLIHGG
jgi:hypothetical protein